MGGVRVQMSDSDRSWPQQAWSRRKCHSPTTDMDTVTDTSVKIDYKIDGASAVDRRRFWLLLTVKYKAGECCRSQDSGDCKSSAFRPATVDEFSFTHSTILLNLTATEKGFPLLEVSSFAAFGEVSEHRVESG